MYSFLIGVLLALIVTRLVPALFIEGYMIRWHLTPRSRKYGAVYLHFYHGSDLRVRHDHPFNSWSICLWGKLEEHYRHPNERQGDEVAVITPGTCRARPWWVRHYLILRSKYAVTLFFVGPLAHDGAWHYYPDGVLRVPFWEWPDKLRSWRWSWADGRYIEQVTE